MGGWRDVLDWIVFCLVVEAIVACFSGAAVVHDSHQFGVRSMTVAALITAGILLILTGVVIVAESIDEAKKKKGAW